VLVRGIAARADAGGVSGGVGGVFVPELFGETAGGASAGGAACAIEGFAAVIQVMPV
jgi:hypothetical protein